jgi:hypothetical protein
VVTGSSSLDLKITLGDATFEAAGDAGTVMKALGEFKALVESGERPKRHAPARDKEPKGEEDGGPAKGQPLPVFVRRNWPDQASKYTAIVLWARENESKPSLTGAEIDKYWKKTPGKAPVNPSQTCKNAESKGWLQKVGGKWEITGHGEEMVNKTPMS